MLGGQLIAIMPSVEDADRALVEETLIGVADAASTELPAVVYRFDAEAPVTVVYAASVRGRGVGPRP